jgi:hypothetical protein
LLLAFGIAEDVLKACYPAIDADSLSHSPEKAQSPIRRWDKVLHRTIGNTSVIFILKICLF